MFSGPLRHYWSTHRGTRQVLRTRPQCLGHRTGSFLERLFLQQYALPLYRSSHTLPLLPVTHRPTGDKRDDIRNSQIWDYKIFFIGEWCEKTILSFLLQQRWWKKYSDYITSKSSAYKLYSLCRKRLLLKCHIITNIVGMLLLILFVKH